MRKPLSTHILILMQYTKIIQNHFKKPQHSFITHRPTYITFDAFNQTEKLNIIYISNSKYNPFFITKAYNIDKIAEIGYGQKRHVLWYAPCFRS